MTHPAGGTADRGDERHDVTLHPAAAIRWGELARLWLSTPRLILSPLADDDRAFFIDLYGDSEVMRHVGPALSATAAAAAFRAARDGMARVRPTGLYFVLRTREDDRRVGLIGCPRVDHARDRFEIGMLLPIPEQGQGIGREAIGCLADALFRDHGARELWVEFAASHRAAERMIGSVGFGPGDAAPTDDGKPFIWTLPRVRWQSSFDRRGSRRHVEAH